MIDPERALAQADLLIVLHDVSNKWTRDSLSPKILRLLHLYPDKESILVLNKIDLLKEKRLLLRLTNKLSQGIIGGQLLNGSDKSAEERRQVQESTKLEQETTHAYPTVLSEKAIAQKIEGMVGWPNFSNVFMVSAIDGDGVTEIMVPFQTIKKMYLQCDDNNPILLFRHTYSKLLGQDDGFTIRRL